MVRVIFFYSFIVSFPVLSLQQERLDSLKQSIDFMSGLDPLTKQPLKSEEQGVGSLDQNKEGASSSGGSERSQTPSTPRCSCM